MTVKPPAGPLVSIGTLVKIRPSPWGRIVDAPALARVCKLQGTTLLVELDCGRRMFVRRERCEVVQ
jgi:hypothetical protein